jgi:hypothetical protein
MAVLFISEDYVKRETNINEDVDNKYIVTMIKDCQDMYIHPLLGTALYNSMKTKITADPTFAGYANYKTLLDEYIIPCLAAYIRYEIPIALNYKFTNKNLGKKSSENTQPADMSELEKVVDFYKNKAEWRAKRLVDYLIENASEMFSEYLDAGSGADTIHPDKDTYDSGMNLDLDNSPLTRDQYLFYKYGKY